MSENDLTCTIVDNCPRGCNCIELPSENLIKINCYSIEFIREFGASLRNFTESHDSYEFEVNLSGKQLQTLNESLIQGIYECIELLKKWIDTIGIFSDLILMYSYYPNFFICRNLPTSPLCEPYRK